jgi:4-hydroxybenzoate polyprenyltransferase
VLLDGQDNNPPLRSLENVLVTNRWWIYQRERFPVLAHGLLIAAFSLSAVCCSSLLRGEVSLPSALSVVVAFGTAFLFFLQLRIADEFKDAEADAQYRPYRPVPRGLVRLSELGMLGVWCAVMQVGLAWLLQPGLIVLLVLVWLYLAVMSREFFVGSWLKHRPLLYMSSHMVIIPLVDFYTSACDWRPSESGPPPGLGWFLAVSYCNGIVLELGRKIRGPQAEEPGVETYSSLWGQSTAVAAWIGALVVTAAAAVMAAREIQFASFVIALLSVLLVAAGWIAWRFLRDPSANGSRQIEALSGVWTLLMYLNLGVVPLVWRWYLSSGDQS